MGDIHGTVKDSQNALEKLLGKIPIIGGYFERREWRQADQVLRQTLAEKLTAQRKRLDTAQKDLINNAKLEFVDDVGSAVTQLQTFIDRIKNASYGYSGLFDAVKINEEELEQMYNFDAALFDYVERLDSANDRLREAVASGQGLAETVRVVQDICRETNITLDDRDNVFMGSQ